MRARPRGGFAPRHVSFDYMSLILTVTVAMGVDKRFATEFLRGFFKGLPANPHKPLSSGYAVSEFRRNERQHYVQHIRFFTPSDRRSVEEFLPGPGVTYERVKGLLEGHDDAAHAFEEHRITIFCFKFVSLQDSHDDNTFMEASKTVMMVLEDITEHQLRRSVYFEDWEERGFKVVSANAAHHLQATLHAALGVWAKEWLKTIYALDDLVSTEVSTSPTYCC